MENIEEFGPDGIENNGNAYNPNGVHGDITETKKDAEEKSVYVYDRRNRFLHECPITKIDKHNFAVFKYTFIRKGENITLNCVYDLNGPQVAQIDVDCGGFDPYYLVSTNRKSLDHIKDSDMYMTNKLQSNLFSVIKQLLKS